MTTKALGNSFYSQAHQSIFDVRRKIQLAKQARAVVSDAIASKALRNMTAVDIGCGSGVTSYELSKFVKRIEGVDYDSQAIAYAQNAYHRKNLRYGVQDAMNLKFRDNSFDLAICQEVYSYVPNPISLMAEILRILKPGGICYFVGDNLLFPVESQYGIPFLHYLPDSVAAFVLRLLGRKNYYLGHYKTCFALGKLCRKFIIHDYTLNVLRNPEKYKFLRLKKFKNIINALPKPILSLLYYFIPTYVWVLIKP